MPINYQAPSGGSYYHAASNFNPAASASLIGHEESLGMQQTLQNQRLLFEGGQQAAMESARLQAAAAMQERRAELQVWVQGQEMTQAEQMQLRQDENAIAWVNSQRGKTLSDQEADDFIASKRMKVDMGKQRLMQAELKQKAAQTEHLDWQSKLLAATYQHASDTADGKRAVIIDKDFMDEAAKYAMDLNIDPKTPEGKAAMESFAVQNGRAKEGWVQKDGTIKPDTPAKGVGAAGGAKGMLTEDQYIKHHETATKMTDQWAKAQETPPSEEARDAHYQKEMDKLEAVRQKYHAQTPQGQQEAKMEEHKGALGKIDTSMSKIMENKDLTPGAKTIGVNMLREIRDLMDRYPPGKSTPAIRAKIKALQEKFDQYQWEAPQTPPTKITPDMIRTEGGGSELQVRPWVKNLLGGYNPQAGGGGGY